ncbi:hypothetical protein AMTR_s00053p00074280 [Amborella trichopoda]|uniref:Uncharacterized protein n=1 Tax=Amborella trichopoda TaxID=13333 RepID=W1PAR7_AMBTC|nr:hypothetical protein AMTR_s00053p00074280 [Amborella trichopoda]
MRSPMLLASESHHHHIENQYRPVAAPTRPQVSLAYDHATAQITWSGCLPEKIHHDLNNPSGVIGNPTGVVDR